MYKFLLCWRYLRTRYIALASVVSVTLGVWIMIVVNSVMGGFSHEMQGRIHGFLSDVEVESPSLEGFRDPELHMQQIREVAGDYIAGMTPMVKVPSMLSFQYGERWITRPIQLIGIDETSHAQVSDFGKYLQHPDNRRQLSFLLKENGFDSINPEAGPGAMPRAEAERWGGGYRRWRAAMERSRQEALPPPDAPADPFNRKASTNHVGDAAPAAPHPGLLPRGEGDAAEAPATAGVAAGASDPLGAPAGEHPHDTQAAAGQPATAAVDPFAGQRQGHTFDPGEEQNTGVVLGIALAMSRWRDGVDHFYVRPGDDVKLTFPTAGTPPKAVSDNFTVVDFYESKMAEYDSSCVFVPIHKLQELRGMIDPQTGIGYVTSIQIKLKNEADGDLVRDKLRTAFPPDVYLVSTWRDKQGALLSAVQMETAVLNLLLFMIIAVAGFGILAIFFMIVVEKTRDIGVLKSLGASSRGILGIFLGYGLSLGAVGAGAGMVAGLLFVRYINQIRDALEWATGRKVFDPSIYYFYKIPTIVNPFTVGWIVLGALVIAVLASVLPAMRAARLHPVEALRYE